MFYSSIYSMYFNIQFSILFLNMITQSSEKLTKTKSAIYPSIEIIQNKNLQLICDYSIEKEFKVCSPKDNFAIKYFKAAQQLFSEIESLSIKQVWICYRQSTFYPIRVYFTQPQKFPVSKCCGRCVYIEFSSDLSGAIKCVQCLKAIFQFISANKHLPQQRIIKKGLKSKHNKTKNFLEFSDEKDKENIDRNNEKMFLDFRQKVEEKKKQVRRLISSKKYKQRPLKNILEDSLLNNRSSKQFDQQQLQFIIEACREDSQQNFSTNIDFNQIRSSIKNQEENMINQTDNKDQIRKIIYDIFS